MSTIDTNITNTLLNSNTIKESNIKKKLEDATNSKDDKALLKACEEFESIFTHLLLKEMRSTVEDGGLTEKSTGREIFEDMYDQEISKQMSKKDNGIGLAKMLYEQMKRR